MRRRGGRRPQRQGWEVGFCLLAATLVSSSLLALLRFQVERPAWLPLAGSRSLTISRSRHTALKGWQADAARAVNTFQNMPSEPGQNSDQVGYEQLCTRWNREEAQAVEISKRTLQNPNTTIQQKMRAVDELEYWAIRRGGYDAEIVLIGTLKSTERMLSGQAHVSLKKTWESHFNAWVNSAIGNAKAMMSAGRPEEALKVFDKVVFENSLWGEGYHLRAKCWNKLGDLNRTIVDLRSALEFCPNNYVTMVELAITLMDKSDEYEEAAQLLHQAADLCPLLPINDFLETLYGKAPHLRPQPLPEGGEDVSVEDVPRRLLPDFWIEKKEATERPNQAFLRVGAELEQWFQKLLMKNPTRSQQRKLWSVLVIKWDPDKFPRPLNSFTTQVHELLKSRRERELNRIRSEQATGSSDEEVWEAYDNPYGDNEDARNFLRQIRAERKKARELKNIKEAAIS